MESFSEWVSSISANGTPVFLGFNASFDWSFVNWYFHTFVGRNPFGFGAVDIKAYFMGLTGCRWEETRSSRLPELLRSKRAAKEQHNALSDALHQAEIFRRMVEFRTQLLDA
jgi:ribonuclease T